MLSKCSQNATKIQPNSATIQSKASKISVKIQSKCIQNSQTKKFSVLFWPKLGTHIQCPVLYQKCLHCQMNILFFINLSYPCKASHTHFFPIFDPKYLPADLYRSKRSYFEFCTRLRDLYLVKVVFRVSQDGGFTLARL